MQGQLDEKFHAFYLKFFIELTMYNRGNTNFSAKKYTTNYAVV